MIGRTHGIHAEPITFGFKIANWYSETQRNIARFRGGRLRTCGSVSFRARWELLPTSLPNSKRKSASAWD